MPAVETEMNPPQSEGEKTMSGPVKIGIIYPPPEVRNIVDKTAAFVARNGPEFEARIRQNELGNPKFNFLSVGDPYHAYYQHKVKEIREGKVADTMSLPAGIQKLSVTSQQRQQELLKQVAEQQFVPKEPPPEFEFIADPPSISALDLDIVKLTAQFVARNGRQFLTNLMNREQRNFQFDFLRPQHSLFQYFTKLLEQYTKILIPPKDLLGKLKTESEEGQQSRSAILEAVKYRANWQKHQEAAKRREEEKVERERVAYAQIDWHDFVVVEVVDYQPYEHGNFPPPTTPEEVGARVLMEERMQETGQGDVEMQLESESEDSDSDTETPKIPLSQMENRIGQRDNNQVQDMDESDSELEAPPPKPAAPVMPPTLDKVVVKKYDPKQVKQIQKPPTSDEYLISPITGERIQASKVAEHMRIGLLDPRWVEQRDKHLEKVAQENVYAPGSAIEASLKQLAERRTDIFGVGDEEAAIGKKLGEEETKKDDRVTWDGHTSSVETVSRAARANISIEDQIHQIHKVKGLIPDEEKEKIGPKPVRDGGPQPPSMSSNIIQAPPPPKIPPQPPMPKPSIPSAPIPGSVAPAIPKAIPGQAAPIQRDLIHPSAPQMRPPQMQMVMPPMQPMMSPYPVAYAQPTAPPPMIPTSLPPPMLEDDQPPNKRARTEDNLIPEQEFLQRHNGFITVQVQIPNAADKGDWKLNGQLVSMTLALTDTIATMKAKLQEEIGMPPAKQKILYDGMFFKDNNSCAYYNLLSGATALLQIKERGGRKK